MAALRPVTALRNRLAAQVARHDQRAWMVTRRERTRQLIELGGLVVKSGLVIATDDDRAVIFGALVECSARLNDDDHDQLLLIWRRRGQREFANTRTPATAVDDIT